MFLKSIESKPAVGIFSKTTDSAFVEAAGIAGLDFIILDQEHGPVSLETLHNHVRAAKLTHMAPVVRVKGLDSHAIGAALDSGAAGVQVPNINTAEQARIAVSAARFHPAGQRGVCRFVRAASYGTQDRAEYFRNANNALLVLQVEGVEGISNLDEILDIKGFDVLFVGPYDLSQSIGKPGEIDSPEVLRLIKTIAEKAKEKGVILGGFCDSSEGLRFLQDLDFRYISYSVDLNIFINSLKGLR
ncbi:MAG: aldolase [Candidimonas sp.]|nr:aldolase [Candidimonas sp.]